jgi:hypothetical protein
MKARIKQCLGFYDSIDLKNQAWLKNCDTNISFISEDRTVLTSKLACGDKFEMFITCKLVNV